AIVALEADHFCAGKVVLEAQDVVDLGPAPAVDRLVVIADAADVLGQRRLYALSPCGRGCRAAKRRGGWGGRCGVCDRIPPTPRLAEPVIGRRFASTRWLAATLSRKGRGCHSA